MVIHDDSDLDNQFTTSIQYDSSSCPHWQVWKAATKLERYGISSASCEQYRSITLQVVSILRQWGNTWGGDPAWKSVLNKNSLEHEAEESIVALYYLHKWLQSVQSRTAITVVDLCCGKGLFSMFLSYMVSMFWKDCGISNIVLLDKSVTIDWDHIDAANVTAQCENRPLLELWKGVNLHKYDALLDRLQQLNAPLALVGIHLCKTLSPSAISLVHGLGTHQCPFLCLVPCCVPRVVTSRIMTTDRRRIGIHQYETPEERSMRRTTMTLRDRARRRGGADDGGVRNQSNRQCYLCESHGHRVRDCPTLANVDNDKDRHRLLQDAARKIPCWQCGNVGHYKVDCPAAGVILPYMEPPTRYWDIESVLTSLQPFEQFCQVLAESMPQNTSVAVHNTGLKNARVSGHDDSKEWNWNQGRKSIYIVAQSVDSKEL